ncbi:MAG: hypothetical protein J5956_11665 [Ruminococcus sp.]|nr:hypothetical protein [Ruminococcus sp.]
MILGKPGDDSYFKYDPSIPYPLQVLDYIKRIDVMYAEAVKEIKNAGKIENLYRFLINHYRKELTPLIIKGYPAESVEEIVRTCVLDTQLNWEWDKYKQIYKFNPELFKLLTEETDADSVMADIFLSKLPFPCFYVDNPIEDGIGNVFVGFYVLIRLGVDNVPELFIEFAQADPERSYRFCAVPLIKGSNKTIDELLTRQYVLAGVDPKDVPQKEVFNEMCKKAINCVAYLCTDKVDVIKTRREVKAKSPKSSKKKPKTVKVGLVGDKIAKVIKENRVRYVYEGNSRPHEKGTPKSAHIRRAHYHSFWTGKRSEPEKRELIVKLISPIFVKGENGADKVTVRKIEKG